MRARVTVHHPDDAITVRVVNLPLSLDELPAGWVSVEPYDPSEAL